MQNCRVSFRHLWQCQEFSDVQLLLKVPFDQAQTHDGVVHQMPAHKVILSLSPYFRAQLVRWSTDNSSSCSGSSTPTVALGLESPKQLAAAMIVLGAMYGLDPDPSTALLDHQLLQVVLIADMLQLADIMKAAVEQLMAVIINNKKLSAPALQQLMRLPALPACLLDQFPALAATIQHQDCVQLWLRSAAPCSPAGLEAVLAAPHSSYMQQRLVGWVRDLDACLDGASSRLELLQLPLAAMQLLLACDSLPVHSEDSVLWTAQAYVSTQATPEQQQAEAQQLAPLVRCPHLSQLWLTAMVASPHASKLLLGQYIPQIHRLLPYMMVYCPAGGSSTTDSSTWQQLVPHAPASWTQPQRPPSGFRSAHTVKLYCSFDLPAVHELFTQAAKKQRNVFLSSKHTTRPLCGLVWRLELHACWQQEQKQATLGLFAAPVNCPPGMFFKYSATISSGSLRRTFPHPADAFGNKGSGFSDFYRIGTVSAVQPTGGWSPLLCQKLSDALHMPNLAAGDVFSTLRDATVLNVSLTVSKAD